jgi:hypothetical protein
MKKQLNTFRQTNMSYSEQYVGTRLDLYDGSAARSEAKH